MVAVHLHVEGRHAEEVLQDAALRLQDADLQGEVCRLEETAGGDLRLGGKSIFLSTPKPLVL